MAETIEEEAAIGETCERVVRGLLVERVGFVARGIVYSGGDQLAHQFEHADVTGGESVCGCRYDFQNAYGRIIVFERRDNHGADISHFARFSIDAGINHCVVRTQDLALSYAEAGETCVTLHPCSEQREGNSANSAVDHFIAFGVLDDGTIGIGDGGDALDHRVDDAGKVEAELSDLRLQANDLHQDVRIGADTALHVGHGPSGFGMECCSSNSRPNVVRVAYCRARRSSDSAESQHFLY